MKKTVHVGSKPELCQCRRCDGKRRLDLTMAGLSFLSIPMHFIACPKCGNKRCPKADYHGYQCTGSNEVAQIGILE